jgi:mRNA interferase RelE/StbE
VNERWTLTVRPSVRRRLAEGLPASVAPAITEFITGPLLENPHRISKPLEGDLAGYYAARRGDYRVIYDIDEAAHTVHIIRVDHRRHVYRR